MLPYRIYFIDEGSICGRHDFSGESDHAAIQMAHVLFEACSDGCDLFDLWQGTRHVAVPQPFVPMTFAELSATAQELVVETEECIVQSQWNIAKSRRLLQALEAKSRQFRQASGQ